MTNAKYLGQYIPTHYHYQMLLDQVRMTGFREAITKLTPADSIVLELGGGTGVLSSFAASRARKVLCIEYNPELVKVATEFLKLNGINNVEVIAADAMSYLPPEPVAVVICEMLHSALLREKQLEVISNFKERYRAKFGDSLPIFIPEATILAFQPVHRIFDYLGYKAPTVMFRDPYAQDPDTTQLGPPTSYSVFEYRNEIPRSFEFNGEIAIDSSGVLNALRFVTKNVLGIILDEKRAIDWHNQYLIVPFKQEISVKPGDKIRISFNYEAGAEIGQLSESLRLLL